MLRGQLLPVPGPPPPLLRFGDSRNLHIRRGDQGRAVPGRGQGGAAVHLRNGQEEG